MQVRSLLNNSIPPLKITDTGSKAIQWMDAFNLNQLPVISGTQYIGLISRADLEHQNLLATIESYHLILPGQCLHEAQHLYEAFSFASNFKCQVIPVVDEQRQYSGIIPVNGLLEKMTETKSFKTPGSIIVIETSRKEHPLSELIEIVESNDGRVLSAEIADMTDSDLFDATLKIDRTDLSRIEAAFYRKNITVKEIYHHSDFAEDLQQRFDSLMNYLNI